MDEADWKDRFDEIAGWLEYDCGLPRKQAEYQAKRNVETERRAFRLNQQGDEAKGRERSPDQG